MPITSPEQVGFSGKRLRRACEAMARYVEQGKIAGIQMLVARKGQTVLFENTGWMNLEASTSICDDTLFRIYSMTKPITSVATMMLLEEGRFLLSDPVSQYIPELKDLKVIKSVHGDEAELEDIQNPITIRHLLTHTAGFSYGFDPNDYLDKLYSKTVWKAISESSSVDLAGFVQRVAQLPLKFQPGTAFNYSIAIDILGYLVQVISGQPFEQFLQERIFDPLQMQDTGFWVPQVKAHRLATMYGPDEDNPGQLKDIDPHPESHYLRPTEFSSGGGGLVSSSADYLRFCQMMLNKGELDGVRLLGRKTVELMTQDNLPRSVVFDPEGGAAFGLGGLVRTHMGKGQTLLSNGVWSWGGAASTEFWVDYQEEIIGILMMQYMPGTGINYQLGPIFANTVYQALV